MTLDRFRSGSESEVRLLLLIDAFSRKGSRRNELRVLEGRVKLAKLDFLMRYPVYLRRALKDRHVPEAQLAAATAETNPLEQRMVRYRYGPWDPAYYALLGSLIGRGLVEVVPLQRGLGFRTTDAGSELATAIGGDEAWSETASRARLLRRYLDVSGTTLKDMVYAIAPEVVEAAWHEPL